MAEMIERLDGLCREAQELRARLERAMAERKRGDMPDRRGQPERRANRRKPREST